MLGNPRPHLNPPRKTRAPGSAIAHAQNRVVSTRLRRPCLLPHDPCQPCTGDDATLPYARRIPRRPPMSETDTHAAIDSVLREDRVFPPPAAFSREARIPDRAAYDALYRRAAEDP